MFKKLLCQYLGLFLKRFDRRKISTKILMQESFNYSIENAQIVNSWILLFSCHIHPIDPIEAQKNTNYIDTIPQKINDLQQEKSIKIPSIYVQSKWLDYFAQNTLSNIKTPFILVSGDNDTAINQQTISQLDTLLNSPYLVRWFAQNKDCRTPRVFPLPIGINLYNQWLDPLQWGGGFILPAMQELQIKTIANKAPSLLQRKPQVFCNWHFSIDRGDRKHCYESIDHSICHFQTTPLPPAQTWYEQSQYQFVLSPPGAGFDCFRTWEALVLGCIPIVKRLPMNDIFQDLPVIEVDNWRQINSGYLQECLSKIQEQTFNYEKLTSQYWIDQIHKD